MAHGFLLVLSLVLRVLQAPLNTMLFLFLIIIIMTTGKEDDEFPSTDKGDFMGFQEMISLFSSLEALILLSLYDYLIPRLDVFGKNRRRSPCVFLNMFDRLKAISREVDEKCCQTVEDEKKASSALPLWGQVLGIMRTFIKLPRLIRAFHVVLIRM